MKLTTIGDTTLVFLSRRNLLAGLHKLEMPNSARTLTKQEDNGVMLVVGFEEDETHYATREPGPMHPDTEAFIAHPPSIEELA